MEYSPDKWILLKIKTKKETIYKVLAGWSGSYLEGQSWRMNSGITKVTKKDQHYLFEGHSGSIYKCHKNGYGTNMITGGVLAQILEEDKERKIVEVLEDSKDFSNLLSTTK